MAKFKVGDKVDVRDGETVWVGFSITRAADRDERVEVYGEEFALRFTTHVDDCIPHVPAPVVQPAPVDRLTGLTAQEMERRYSARLTAFGRGDADPYALRNKVQAKIDAWRAAKTCGKCGSTIENPGPCPVCEDRPFGPMPTKRHLKPAPPAPETEPLPEPRPLIIEDVKVGSRWVRDDGYEVEVEQLRVDTVMCRNLRFSVREALSYAYFLDYFKPAPDAPARPAWQDTIDRADDEERIL